MSEWEDQALPGLDMEPAEPRRKRPKDTRVKWSRYKGNRYACVDCIEERSRVGSGAVRYASHIRSEEDIQEHFCFAHAEDRKLADHKAGVWRSAT